MDDRRDAETGLAVEETLLEPTASRPLDRVHRARAVRPGVVTDPVPGRLGERDGGLCPAANSRLHGRDGVAVLVTQ